VRGLASLQRVVGKAGQGARAKVARARGQLGRGAAQDSDMFQDNDDDSLDISSHDPPVPGCGSDRDEYFDDFGHAGQPIFRVASEWKEDHPATHRSSEGIWRCFKVVGSSVFGYWGRA